MLNSIKRMLGLPAFVQIEYVGGRWRKTNHGLVCLEVSKNTLLTSEDVIFIVCGETLVKLDEFESKAYMQEKIHLPTRLRVKHTMLVGIHNLSVRYRDEIGTIYHTSIGQTGALKRINEIKCNRILQVTGMGNYD